MIRQTLVSIALATLLAAPAGGQEAVERRFPVAADAYVKVFLQRGSVHVTGWEKDSVAVTGSVERGSLFAGGADRAAKLGVWIDESTEGGSARLEVRVPASATVWIKSESADVRVAGVDGGVDAYSVTGTIFVTDNPRQVYAESMGGRIEVVADATSIRAKSAGGDVFFRGRVDDLSLSSVSGIVQARTAAPQRARLETVTGPIRWSGGVEQGGALEIVTHSGTVDLAMPSEIGAEIEVATVRGKLVNRLASGNGGPASRPLREKRLDLVAGDGGARVTVKTFSGGVTLRPR